jgi:beta-lactamase superfamily II metal-dependent hydrolase
MKERIAYLLLLLGLSLTGCDVLESLAEETSVEANEYSIAIVNTDEDPYWFGNLSGLTKGETMTLCYTVQGKDTASYKASSSIASVAVVANSSHGHFYPTQAPADPYGVEGYTRLFYDYGTLADTFFGVGHSYVVSFTPQAVSSTYDFKIDEDGARIWDASIPYASYFGIMVYPFSFTLNLTSVRAYSSSDLGVYSYNGGTAVYSSEVTLTKNAHSLVHHPYLAPTETSEGNLDYYRCSNCGKYFADANGELQVESGSVLLNKITKHHTYQVEAVNQDADPWWIANQTALRQGESYVFSYDVLSKENAAYTGVGEAYLSLVSNDGLGKLYPGTAKETVPLLVEGKAVNKTANPFLSDVYFGAQKSYVVYLNPLGDGTTYFYAFYQGSSLLQSGSIAYHGYFGLSIYPYNFTLSLRASSYSSSQELGVFAYDGGTSVYHTSVTKELWPEEIHNMSLDEVIVEGASAALSADGYEGDNAICLTPEGDSLALDFVLPESASFKAGDPIHVSLRLKFAGSEGNYINAALRKSGGVVFDSAFPEESWNRISYDSVVFTKNGKRIVPLTITGLSAGKNVSLSDVLFSAPEALSSPLLGGAELYQMEYTANLMEGYVLKSPEGKLLVIDGGDSADAPTLYRLLCQLGAAHVDGWFLSHYHCDHINALIALLNNYDLSVDTLYYDFPTDADFAKYGDDGDAHCVDDLAAALSAHPEKVKTIVTPKAKDVYSYGSLSVKVLNDAYKGAGNNYGNDTSIVYKVLTPKESILFLGDLGERGDVLLADSTFVSEISDCAVVQLAHHGQNGCTSKFYDHCSAMKIALIPAAQWIYDNNNGGGFNSGKLLSLSMRSYIRERGILYRYTAIGGRILLK